MKALVVVMLVFAATGALAAPEKKSGAQDQQLQKRIEGAKARVLETLKDPDSAKFKEVYVASDGETLCGSVNSKNSYGGYVGFQSFMIEPDGRLFFDDSGPSFPGMIQMACKK